jgi:hypothetical protein
MFVGVRVVRRGRGYACVNAWVCVCTRVGVHAWAGMRGYARGRGRSKA